MTHARQPMFQDSKTIDFICGCGLDYFKVKKVKGSLKSYIFLECPACGQVITEDITYG